MERGKIALALLLALCSASAAAYVGDGEGDACFADFADNDATVWIGMAFMLTVGLVALAHMFGNASDNEQMKVWAKDEVFSLGVAAVVVVAVVAFTIGSCEVLSAITNDAAIMGEYATSSPFISSYRYLDDLSTSGIGSVETLVKQSLQKQLDATAFLYIGVPTLKSTGVPLRESRKALSAHQEMVMDIMLPLVVSLHAQKYALQLIEIVGMSVLLPFAVIMRIVPFTRNAGNFMLAGVFCLYVFVPATYALGGAAWNNMDPEGVLVSYPQVFSFQDRALGEACTLENCQLYKISSMIPQAIFMPNLALVIFMSGTMALSRALAALPT